MEDMEVDMKLRELAPTVEKAIIEWRTANYSEVSEEEGYWMPTDFFKPFVGPLMKEMGDVPDGVFDALLKYLFIHIEEISRYVHIEWEYKESFWESLGVDSMEDGEWLPFMLYYDNEEEW